MIKAEKHQAFPIVLLIIGLCLLAFGLRTWQLEAKSIWWDESLSLYRARLSIVEILSGHITFTGVTTTDLHPPLYFLLLATLTRLAGESDFVLRFLSVAWAVLLVPLLYVTGTRFWGWRTGLLAAFLGALSPFYLWYAQEARMYTMTAALGLFAVYGLERGIEERKRGWLIASAVAAVAVAYTHYLAATLLPILGLRALMTLGVRVERKRRPMLLAVLGAAVLVSLPVISYVIWRLGLGPEAGREVIPLHVMLIDALHAFHVGLSLDRFTYWPLDLVALTIYLVGALWFDRHRRRHVLWAYVLVPIVALYLVSLIKPLYMGSRYLIFVTPAFYLGMGRGLSLIGRRSWPLSLLAGAVVAGSMGLSTVNYFRDPQFRAKEDHRSSARYIEQRERPGDVIVINAPEKAITFLHYYRGKLPLVGLPPVAMEGNPDRAASDRAAAAVAARYERVWLVNLQATWSDPNGYVEAWFSRNTFLAERVVYPSYVSDAIVQLYLTRNPASQEVPAHQHTLQVDFGSLRLEGYDLPLRPTAGGERAWITLYWRVLEAGRNAKVSLRLVDARGELWGQVDELPYTAFPPKHWPAGQVMRHEVGFPVPPGVPPGWYHLELRLYDPVSGRPIEPRQGANPGALALSPMRIDGTWLQGGVFPRSSPSQRVLFNGGMHFGDALTLRAYDLGSRSVRPGEWLHVSLFWQVGQPPERDLTLGLELVDARGQVICSHSATPVSALYTPGFWRSGELLWTQHSLLLPPTVQPGSYDLRISVRDAAGRRLPIRNNWQFWTWGEDWARLTRVRVEAVPRTFTRPPMEHVLEAEGTVGIDLLGYDGEVARLKGGQQVDVTLHWRATTVLDKSYKVSVQLLGADRRTILAQDDAVPAEWSRPTTGWSMGEIVSDLHQLTLPAEVRPQEAMLIVALYDEDTGRRVQWLHDGATRDHVVLCPVQIVD